MKKTVIATIPNGSPEYNRVNGLPYDQYTGMSHAKLIEPTVKQERMQSMIKKSIDANRPDLDKKLKDLLKENDIHTKISKYKETVKSLKAEILKDLEITKSQLLQSKEYKIREEQYVELNKYEHIVSSDFYVINLLLSITKDL